MSGNDNGTGVAGSPYTHYEYNGIYDYDVGLYVTSLFDQDVLIAPDRISTTVA